MQEKDRIAEPQRRGFLKKLSSIAMLLGLGGGYGAFAFIAGRFLFPADARRGWLFVRPLAEVGAGDSFTFLMPSGATVVVARQGAAGNASDFIALSSVCPHLGCQVHWEEQNKRFFCPCHNGVFDPTGKAVSGPPAQAGQSLLRYPLKVEKGLLYIEASLDELARGEGEVLRAHRSPQGPGHDPCLEPNRRAVQEV